MTDEDRPVGVAVVTQDAIEHLGVERATQTVVEDDGDTQPLRHDLGGLSCSELG